MKNYKRIDVKKETSKEIENNFTVNSCEDLQLAYYLSDYVFPGDLLYYPCNDIYVYQEDCQCDDCCNYRENKLRLKEILNQYPIKQSTFTIGDIFMSRFIINNLL